ncbi:hypothetical protein [Vulcanisaeta souniana]|uniref:Uncharacterized protein n=1 Tax=Vulcanisaeta souniana JCM 11219 TaxID=1293586 RepID=A0A830DZ72_9CREN|nr:hypothetical protein [Vulcanisaeta souniana]BDR92200.1 hypothetical protein Vsou_12930 [Vulcanisaeta souniana JCM 11219]GGI67156.1 hypothetical protein GCM10007112_00160 [Vulcanisaeta souniana JCM 11219]
MFIRHAYEGDDGINLAIAAAVGLVFSMALLLFIRLIRPISLSVHRELFGAGIFAVSILFFLWLLTSSVRSKRRD